ncbi:MAG: CinA family protein [Gammaproteobacteria bacterium]|nr:CinA family protein [Gammaproteobacteria bacterium]MCP5202110.1 CinA family protein [Gammaproteobacteria bacterium]
MSINVDAAVTVGELLKARGHTVGVAESSTGGLISASLLAVPGASAYFQGSVVIYTMRARRELLGIDRATLERQEPLTEAYVMLCAETIRSRLRADWGIAELGATGPAGTPYGHPPGICVLAVSGPVGLSRRLETGHGDREQNMALFTRAAFELFAEALAASA